MNRKKLKIILTITVTFVVCYLLTMVITGVIQKKAEAGQPEYENQYSLAEVIVQSAKQTLLSTGKAALHSGETNEPAPAQDDLTVSINELYAGDDVADNEQAYLAEAEKVQFFAAGTSQVNIEESEIPLAMTRQELTLTAEEDENKADVEAEEFPDPAEHVQLIGIFGQEDWYTKIELPVTSEYVIAKVNEAVNVREGPSTDTKIVGKLKVKNYAKILERGEEWTKIESGKVTGYVNNNYLYMDAEAIELFEEWDAFQVEVKASRLNIRTQPNTDCEILAQATNGDSFTWLPERSVTGWFAIQYDENTVAYVSDQHSDSVVALKTAITIEEEEARIRAEKYAKALEQSKKNPPSQVNREPMEFTDEELYLMAAVIAMEALSESYEGKLAVANVIINRIRDGYWGDTLNEVIYAPGQFSGANEGRVQKFWNQVTESCKRAAVEAAAGNNNIGDYLFFISLRKADYDKYTKYYILGGHCFYARKW